MAYPGGKNGSGVYQKLINLIPPHDIYVEAFLGGGAIMRLKRPARVSIGIDRLAAALAGWSDAAPGITAILLLGDAFELLPALRLCPSAVVYLDPPYLLETRSDKGRLYEFELTRDDHARLLRIARALTCRVLISGYWSELYACELRDWRLVKFTAMTRGGKLATECVWLNYPEPIELHDYRYLGENFRQRERIKRRKLRWKNRLLRMPDLERHAVLQAIRELQS